VVHQGRPQAVPVGLNTTGNGVDDPDQNFFENFSCKSERNYTGYCNPEIEKLMEKQSQIADMDERKKLVWEIDKKLLEDYARADHHVEPRGDLHAALC
jgi:peptide/nickel transport system substrate-binding protein